MEKYFNIKFEFDHLEVDRIIEESIKTGGKGYVCSVEGNNIALCQVDQHVRSVVNNSLVNICDGSSIAILASIIHKKRLSTYVGADLFINYIRKKKYKSFFLGNTPEVLRALQDNLSSVDPLVRDMEFQTLPFCDINDFDYSQIAEVVNMNNPDIIWVSLGAPKQELFMNKLLPFLNRGVMFGFGAIFNFYARIDNTKRAPKIMLNFKLEWLYRLIVEPKKQSKRLGNYLSVLPKMIYEELKNY
ncbi:MAG: WecB/TagA/CpsF family glycosyltransferase [Bacteroidales bacterium]|nr:WecB/TagA/CpsF family glycosyltransferase [Bacteroidales bacterium]